MADVILTCAVTGTRDTFRQNPAVPVTPADIARSALDAASAGAAVVHLHVRDPETGKPSSDLALYREVIDRIRAENAAVLINLTTGQGSRIAIGDDDATIDGSAVRTPDWRVAHIRALKPEICSLDIGTMSIGDAVRLGTPRQMAAMAKVMREAGSKPELDVFDTGNIVQAEPLLASGDVADPPLFQFVLGAKWGAPATAETVLHMRGMLPKGALWSAMGVGAAMFPMVAQAALLGGNVRVGLEDDIFIAPGALAPSNAALVERAAALLAILGIGLAGPAEARRRLGIG
jgi:uncharacterized protein (DUF849 family)